MTYIIRLTGCYDCGNDKSTIVKETLISEIQYAGKSIALQPGDAV